MSDHLSDLLEELRDDADARGLLSTALREAADLLDGTTSAATLGSEASLLRVSYLVAGRLRDVSQRLCDHEREDADGRCRYCRVLLRCGALASSAEPRMVGAARCSPRA